MTDTKHTALPWSLLPARTMINIKGPNGEQVGQIPKRRAADADLLIRAVNRDPAFDEVVKALEPFAKAAHLWGKPDDPFEDHDKLGRERNAALTVGDLRRARAALAKAGSST